MADASRHSLYYIAESSYGVTPATPSFTNLRNVGCTLALTKGGLQSGELQSHRQLVDFRHGVRQTGGEVSVELSYGTFDDLLQALLGGTWVTDQPSAGTDRLRCGTTRRSFSMLRDFSDLTDARYHLFTGAEVNTLSLNVTPEAIVTGSFGFIGKDATVGASAPASSTLGSASTTKVFDAFSGAINEGGSSIAIVTALDLNFANNIAPRFVVGSSTTIRPSIGQISVTGNLTVYFETVALLNKFLNETESSIDFTLTDAAGNDLQFLLPRVKYTGGQPDVGGDGPITMQLPIQALYDATTTTTLEIRRTDA